MLQKDCGVRPAQLAASRPCWHGCFPDVSVDLAGPRSPSAGWSWGRRFARPALARRRVALHRIRMPSDPRPQGCPGCRPRDRCRSGPAGRLRLGPVAALRSVPQIVRVADAARMSRMSLPPCSQRNPLSSAASDCRAASALPTSFSYSGPLAASPVIFASVSFHSGAHAMIPVPPTACLTIPILFPGQAAAMA